MSSRRWTESEKEMALQLRRKGYIYPEISAELNRSESSVSHFFHRTGYKYAKDEKIQRRVQAVQKKKEQEVKEIVKNLKYDENLGYVIGALYGDGTVKAEPTRGMFRLSVKDKSFAEAFLGKVKEVFGLEAKFRTYTYQSTGKFYSVSVYRKYLTAWLDQNFGPFGEDKWNIDISKFLNYGIPFCKGFVKGFFDAEGSIGKEKTPLKNIQFVSSNKMGLMTFHVLLAAILDFEPRMAPKKERAKWELTLPKRQSQLFAAIIGSEIDYKKNRLERLMKMPPARGGWTDQQDKWLQELVIEGKSAPEIGKIMVRSPDQVRNRVKKLNLSFLWHQPTISKEILRKLYIEKKLTAGEISKKMGFNRKTVSHYLDIYGMKRSRSEVKKVYYSQHEVWNKGRPKVKPNLGPSEDLCYILGVLKGDGYVTGKTHPKICLETKTPQFNKSFEQALEGVGLNPCSYLVRDGKLRTAAQSIAFSNWYKTLNLEDIERIVIEQPEFIIAFLRGFYESEGLSAINRSKKTGWIRWRVLMFNTDLKLTMMVQRLLHILGFRFALGKQLRTLGPVWIKGRLGKINRSICYNLESVNKDQNYKFMNVIQPYIKNDQILPRNEMLKEERLRWIKAWEEGRFRTKRELCKYFNISKVEKFNRWYKRYLEEGIRGLANRLG